MASQGIEKRDSKTDYPVLENNPGSQNYNQPNIYSPEFVSSGATPFSGGNGAISPTPSRSGAQHPRASSHFVTTPLEAEVIDQPFGFKSNRVRLNFIRKVLSILSFQFLITVMFIVASVHSPHYQNFIKENVWVTGIALVTVIITTYALGCYTSVARSIPINYILLMLFTLSEAYLVSGLTAVTDPKIVLTAGVLTVGMVVALTLYALTTKTDFTMCGGLLFVAVLLICLASLMVSFFSSFFDVTWMELTLSVLSIFVFSIYLIHDLQLLTGERSHQFTVDDYIMASLMIYIDIIRIFVEILKILNKTQHR